MSVSESIATELHHEIPLPISVIERRGHIAPTVHIGHSHHKNDAGAVHEHYFMSIEIRICNHIFFVNKSVIHCNQLTAFMWIIILRRFVKLCFAFFIVISVTQQALFPKKNLHWLPFPSIHQVSPPPPKIAYTCHTY